MGAHVHEEARTNSKHEEALKKFILSFFLRRIPSTAATVCHERSVFIFLWEHWRSCRNMIDTWFGARAIYAFLIGAARRRQVRDWNYRFRPNIASGVGTCSQQQWQRSWVKSAMHRMVSESYHRVSYGSCKSPHAPVTKITRSDYWALGQARDTNRRIYRLDDYRAHCISFCWTM